MHNKRLIVDFDDTIAFTKNRDWKNAKPNTDLINKLNKLSKEGWTVDIFTARGSISCKTRYDAEEKYGDQIREWLDDHNVNYNMLSFDKPLGAYYIDDKGITPEDFILTDIRELEGGLSGSDIYTDGKLVHKTADNAHLAHAWFSYVNGYLNVPRIDRVVGQTITMEYIDHDEFYLNNFTYRALGLIQESLDRMSNMDLLENSYTFDDYVKRIEGHIKLAGDIPEFTDTLQRLKELDLQPTFSHGDFGVKNMLFKYDELYLIDPILDTFGCTELDVAKFIASLYINEYYDLPCLAIRTLCAFNKFEEDDITTLVKAEIIRVYKYHPDKQFIINKVQQAEADFWRRYE